MLDRYDPMTPYLVNFRRSSLAGVEVQLEIDVVLKPCYEKQDEEGLDGRREMILSQQCRFVVAVDRRNKVANLNTTVLNANGNQRFRWPGQIVMCRAASVLTYNLY